MNRINNFFEKNKYKVFWIILLPILLVILIWISQIYAYYYFDPEYCIPRIAEKLNTDQTWASIAIYAKKKIEPGMTREDVLQVIHGIGNFEIDSYRNIYSEDSISEDYQVKICWSRRYDIDIKCKYSKNMILKSFSIDMKP